MIYSLAIFLEALELGLLQVFKNLTPCHVIGFGKDLTIAVIGRAFS
jgi:hypothetical protein